MTDLSNATPTIRIEQADASRWQLVGEGDWLDGQAFAIGEHAVLGRDISCDIIIPGKHLSRRHAEIIVQPNGILVRDLGSANGTFVGEERIAERLLHSGDVVRFDVLKFRLQGPSVDASRKRPANADASARMHSGEEKRWKTKPTSVGNRHNTESFTLPKNSSHWLWWAATLLLAGTSIAALWYLFTQL